MEKDRNAELDNVKFCISVSYLLITGDGAAIIQYRCHLSGVGLQWRRRSVAQRGPEPARTPLKIRHWRRYNFCKILARYLF